jgi:hypothetical protein
MARLLSVDFGSGLAAADSMLAAAGFYNGTTHQLKGICP